MIIFADKVFQTRSDLPDTNWIPPEFKQPKYVIPDNSELAAKILALFPNFEFVEDENGELIDII